MAETSPPEHPGFYEEVMGAFLKKLSDSGDVHAGTKAAFAQLVKAPGAKRKQILQILGEHLGAE